MKNAQNQVREWMKLAGQECPDKPTMPTLSVKMLRADLIKEEFDEFYCAIRANDITQSYDAILDLLYVTIGTAVAMGLDLEAGWQEVHRSNMSKFIDGTPRADGKWLKGPSYSPANLAPIIEAQSK